MNRFILNSIYQSLIGAWIFISPFVFGYGNLTQQPAVNNMLFGGFAAILGVVSAIYIWSASESYCRNEVLPAVTQLEEVRRRKAAAWREEERKAA